MSGNKRYRLAKQKSGGYGVLDTKTARFAPFSVTSIAEDVANRLNSADSLSSLGWMDEDKYELADSDSDANNSLLAALKYARRFLKPEDHDTAYIDSVIQQAEAK